MLTRILSIRGFDGDKDRQCLFGQGDRGGDITQFSVFARKVVEVDSLAAPIPDLPRDDKGLSVKLDGAPCLAQSGVGEAQSAEADSLAAPIPDLPRDAESLFVKLDGALCLA
nr:hypothetical protein [Azospirillum sp.]